MKTKYLAFAAAAFMLASCSNDEDFVPQDNLKDAPITVTADVADLKTRAGYDADNLPAKFYLTVTQTEEASQYNYTNVEMTKGNGNNYTPSDNILWKDATRTPFVSAYTTADATFTVQTDQSTAENVIASDLLGAVSTTDGDVTISGNNISVRFRHLLCKLDITYSWGTEFGDVTKSIKSVEYQGFGTDVTLDRAACTISGGTTTDYIKAYISGSTSEAIFAPQSATPKIVITAMIDNVERIFSINVTAPTDGFVSGNRYTMNVTIGGTATETSGISIAKGWGDSITGDDMQTE
jgi:hypothetical protein